MFTWKILEVSAKDGVITHARYHVTASNEDKSVETEGNWYFDCPSAKIEFDKVTEEMVASWIEQEAQKDGKCHITARLEEQLEALENKVVPPWQPQVFKVGM
jgi:hypothetical protein